MGKPGTASAHCPLALATDFTLYMRRLCTPFKPLFAYGGTESDLTRVFENQALNPRGQIHLAICSWVTQNTFRIPLY